MKKEITASSTFSLPVSLIEEMNKVLELCTEDEYRNKSQLGAKAIRKEIESWKTKNSENGNNGNTKNNGGTTTS